MGLGLANLALQKTYQENIQAQFPIYRKMEVEKDRVVISFDTKESLTSRGKIIKGLYVAGEKRIFYPANGKIRQPQLIVWSSRFSQTATVCHSF